MAHKTIIVPRYEFTCYDGQKIDTQSLSESEAKEVNHQSYDFFMSQSQAIWGYRDENGQWIEHHIEWPGLGNTCIKIIQAVQLNAPSFMAPAEIAYLTGIGKLAENNNLSARYLTLRKAHGESFSRPRFWLSRRAGGMAVAWNAKHTWAWLERIAARTHDKRRGPKNTPRGSMGLC